ncbi:hypothetical protein BGW39_007114 [Mortierella sp. 14UC]|nr:hypothetical protein BGW39_007114 [Mortierella sp. 14UC]
MEAQRKTTGSRTPTLFMDVQGIWTLSELPRLIEGLKNFMKGATIELLYTFTEYTRHMSRPL